VKLSNPQQKVIDLMKAGWELGVNGGINNRAWLQRDGCGRGGPTEDVHFNTFYALYKRHLIVIKKAGFPTATWRLKDETVDS